LFNESLEIDDDENDVDDDVRDTGIVLLLLSKISLIKHLSNINSSNLVKLLLFNSHN